MYRLSNTLQFQPVRIVESNGTARSIGPLQSLDTAHLTKAIQQKINAGDLTVIDIMDTTGLAADDASDLVNNAGGGGTGRGIQSITRITGNGAAGTIDTYRIDFTDSLNPTTYTVLNGANGTQGIQGVTGAQGPQGMPGSAGATGNTGTAGTNGTAGAQGIQGIQGAQGAQGIQGVAGSFAYNKTNRATPPSVPSGKDGVLFIDENGILCTVDSVGTVTPFTAGTTTPSGLVWDGATTWDAAGTWAD